MIVKLSSYGSMYSFPLSDLCTYHLSYSMASVTKAEGNTGFTYNVPHNNGPRTSYHCCYRCAHVAIPIIALRRRLRAFRVSVLTGLSYIMSVAQLSLRTSTAGDSN